MLIREIIFDEKLPQMRALLDASAMRAVFERELASAYGRAATETSIWRIDECSIASAKYRPRQNFLIAYRLKIADLPAGPGREQLVTVLACPEGESLPLFRNAMGVGVFHLPELEAVVRAFPNDRKLTGLPALVDPLSLGRRFLPEIVAADFGSGWRIEELESSPVQYRPERACTVRVNLHLRNVRTAAGESLVLFGKTYCQAEGEAAWLGLQTLWNSEARREGRIAIPRPLAYQAEIKTLWQCGLEGKPLNEFNVCSGRFGELLEQAGSTLAELHRTPPGQIAAAPVVATSDIVSQLETAAHLLGRLPLKRSEELRSVIGKLTALSECAVSGLIATLHGDLHLKNLLVTKERIVLLDLDNLSLGDPLRELGSFIASLQYLGLINRWPVGTVREI
ncbi:MAG: phosphotransferase, partial [Blastocatellia bacterium]|nr:phosphotransferase [Blastocatellia bacterium]